jgi:hypothetical protein
MAQKRCSDLAGEHWLNGRAGGASFKGSCGSAGNVVAKRGCVGSEWR